MSDVPPRRLGPFLYAPRPRRRGDNFHVKVAIAAGLLAAAFHDVVYRQTQPAGVGDFEFFGTISHAGLDVVIATGVIALALAVVKR